MGGDYSRGPIQINPSGKKISVEGYRELEGFFTREMYD